MLFLCFRIQERMRCSQFSYLYLEATKPVAGILHYVGEAASVRHG